MHLNEDCQMVICDFLDIFHLLPLAKVNKNLLAIVEDVLKRRFIKKSLIFRSPYNDYSHKFAREYVNEFVNYIEIQHLPTVHTITQTFGHLIRKLMIAHEYKLPDNQSTPIYQAINMYCAETLQKFHIVIKNGDIFTKFKQPFKSVEQITLNGKFVNLDTPKLTFSVMFPTLKRLNLASAKIQHINSFNQSLPHLEELTTDTMGNMTSLTRILIKDNHQIRRLSLFCAQPELLAIVADNLLNLEHLTLEYYHEYSVDGNFSFNFKFQHVKSFRLLGNTMPTNITFGGLEELEIVIQSQQNAKWIDMVVRHKSTLRKLDFITHLNGSEIMQLANAHLNIVKLRFIHSYATPIEHLIDLANSCKQLKRLELYVSSDELRESTFDALKNYLRRRWTIHMIGEYLYLDRD